MFIYFKCIHYALKGSIVMAALLLFSKGGVACLVLSCKVKYFYSILSIILRNVSLSVERHVRVSTAFILQKT